MVGGHAGEQSMRHGIHVQNPNSQHVDRQRQQAGDFGKRSSPLSGERRDRAPSAARRRKSLVSLQARMRQNMSQSADALLKDSGKAASNSPDAADMANELTEQD